MPTSASKGFGLLVSLIMALSSIRSYHVILIQNPPCLPAVVAAYLLSMFNGSVIIVDWHNFGFTMFKERLGGPNHMLVQLVSVLEKTVTLLADAHICISKVMRRFTSCELRTKISRCFWALQDVSNALCIQEDGKNNTHIRIMVVVTGKGPLEAVFEESVRKLTATGKHFIT